MLKVTTILAAAIIVLSGGTSNHAGFSLQCPPGFSALPLTGSAWGGGSGGAGHGTAGAGGATGRTLLASSRSMRNSPVRSSPISLSCCTTLYAASSSACHASRSEPPACLVEAGLRRGEGVVRFSLGADATAQMVDEAVVIFKKAVHEVRTGTAGRTQ